MTTTDIRPNGAPAQLGRKVATTLIAGDLSRLSDEEKVNYYLKVCESLGLNPYTKPFDYLRLQGREILYARKDATDQLRSIHRVSITTLERTRMDDLMVVSATAQLPDGRTDSAIGAVPVQGLKGDALANALMKAETKAKRRVTLSICGLGLTDEAELDTMAGAEVVEQQLPSLKTAAVPATVDVYKQDDMKPPATARRHAEIFSRDELKDALERNSNLQTMAFDLGVPGLRSLKADDSWSLEKIEQANRELGERIKSRNTDLDEQLAGQTELPA